MRPFSISHVEDVDQAIDAWDEDLDGAEDSWKGGSKATRRREWSWNWRHFETCFAHHAAFCRKNRFVPAGMPCRRTETDGGRRGRERAVLAAGVVSEARNVGLDEHEDGGS